MKYIKINLHKIQNALKKENQTITKMKYKETKCDKLI